MSAQPSVSPTTALAPARPEINNIFMLGHLLLFLSLVLFYFLFISVLSSLFSMRFAGSDVMCEFYVAWGLDWTSVTLCALIHLACSWHTSHNFVLMKIQLLAFAPGVHHHCSGKKEITGVKSEPCLKMMYFLLK